MCRKHSEAQGTGRGSEKGAEMQAEIYGISDTVCRQGIMNSTEGIISQILDGLSKERTKKTKIQQKSGKDGSGREGEHEGQEMWEAFKNKWRNGRGK